MSAIRPVHNEDLDPLAALARRSYRAAFGTTFPAEDVEAYIAATRSAGAFRKALRTDVILVAEERDALRGYVQFGPVQTPDLEAGAHDGELRALYVDPQCQNRGIGGRLLIAALEHPRLLAAEQVFLDVWIRNAGARRLYERHGFRVVGERPFHTPSGVAGDPDLIMMRRRPSTGPASSPEGEAVRAGATGAVSSSRCTD